MRWALLLAVAMCGFNGVRAEEPKPADTAAFVGEWLYEDKKNSETIGIKFTNEGVMTVALNGKETIADAKKVMKFEVKQDKELIDVDFVSLIDNKEVSRLKLIAKFTDADTLRLCGPRGKDADRPTDFTDDTQVYTRKK